MIVKPFCTVVVETSLNYLYFLFVVLRFDSLVNYDYLVNLDVESKLRLKYFYDSSLTLCELVLLLIFLLVI